VVIRSSSAREVQQLVAELRQADSVRREAAIARLRVVGSRAVAKIAALVRHDVQPSTRVAALRVLEGIDDPQAVDLGLLALRDGERDVRIAAIAVLRSWVTREEGTRVMDALVATALDRAQDSGVRLAALDSLSELPRDIVQPIIEQTSLESRGPESFDEPAVVQDWLASHRDASLSLLHEVIVRIREIEAKEPGATRRRLWATARGAVHAVLAERESRIALYDLRETFEAANGPLPGDFLAAITAIGDAACIEPLGRAWAAASASEVIWRTRLADAAALLGKRHALSGRSAIVKRVKTKWPGFLR
jgi:hypothetical protein